VTPEGKIEAHLVKRVRETGGYIRKLKWIGRNGAPDRMVWWKLQPAVLVVPFFVELKRPYKDATPQQREEHRKMRDSGLRVFVLNSIEKVDAFVDLYSKRNA